MKRRKKEKYGRKYCITRVYFSLEIQTVGKGLREVTPTRSNRRKIKNFLLSAGDDCHYNLNKLFRLFKYIEVIFYLNVVKNNTATIIVLIFWTVFEIQPMPNSSPGKSILWIETAQLFMFSTKKKTVSYYSPDSLIDCHTLPSHSHIK